MFSNDFSGAVGPILFIFLIYTYIAMTLASGYFYSGRIRTLVAMATYKFHRLIIGKVDIDIFSVSMGIFGF